MELQSGVELTKDELVVSQVVPGSPVAMEMDEFIQMAYGEEYAKDPVTGLPKSLRLGIEKFRMGYGIKYYRLIWAGMGKACLAAERPEEYQRKIDAILNGQALCSETGAVLDTRTR